MKTRKPPHILVSRCDRLGDLILSLPAIAHLRRAQLRGEGGAESRLYLHCSAYAKVIGQWAEFNGICTDLWIDGEPVPMDLQAEHTWALSLFHSDLAVKAFRRAGVLRSVGPRTKLSALWAYKHSVAQHRSRVQKSEMAYNVDLAQVLLAKAQMPSLAFEGLSALKTPETWRSPFSIADVLIFASNGGSAHNWPLSKYIVWAEEQISLGKSVQFVIHGTDAEDRKREFDASSIASKAQCLPSFDDLSSLIAHIQSCGEVLSSSTGPLHIAYALGKPVTGLYPREPKVQSFERWRPDGYWHASPLRWIHL